MFYCLLFFFILILILSIVNNQKHWSRLLIFMNLSYFLAICSMLIYLSKDTYYANIITSYFFLPKFFWKKLFFLNIDRFYILRVLNWSSSAIVFFSLNFTFSIIKFHKKNIIKLVNIFILSYLIILNIIYDPSISIWIYYKLYPAVFTVRQFIKMQNDFHTVTQFINCGILATTLLFLLQHCFRSLPVKIIRAHLFVVFGNYFVMCICYFMFLSFAPNFYLTISKTAKTYYYQPIRLSTSTLGYQIFPYLLVIAALLISVFYIRYLNLIRKIETANSDIAKQISASETTSKVFCHFIKNELLGIQSEIATLPATPENDEQIQLLLKHCQLLYNRIDSIHRSTKTSELHLKKTSLFEVLRSTLELLKSELKNIDVIEKFPREEVYVLADSEYLGQALHNLIHNAITAMEDKAKTKDFSPKLIFEVYQTEKWLILTVEDNGTGISENNISQIFTPFFSSKPFSEHWGVGLSLTHKIIQAHDGHVQVESVYGKGTCFKILLPNFFNIYV